MYQPAQSVKSKAARPRLRALLIFGSLAAVAVLFFAKPLFNSSYIFPWDFRYVQVPLISLLADELRAGRFPLWDPYTYAGNPIYANIQACFFHPLVLLAAVGSNWVNPDTLPLFLEWMVVAQVVAAGWATYVLSRDVGASRAGGWAAAVMCECGPYFASRTEHMGSMTAAAWMPLAWLAVWRLSKGRSRRWLAVLAASLGMSVLGGSPAATVAVFASTFGLAILMGRVRGVALTAVGCVLGLGLSAIEFLPASELTQHSVAKYRLDWLGTGGGLKLESLVSLVAPDHYRIFHLKEFQGPGDPTFLYLYCGLLGLLLAVYAMVRVRTRAVAVFSILAGVGCFWMLGDSTALWRAVYPLVPGAIRIGIHPEFTYCIFAECVAILAGLGLSRLPLGGRVQWAAALVIAADLYATGSRRPMNCSAVREEPGLTRDAIDGSRELLTRVRSLANASNPPARIDEAGASIDWAECAPMTRVATGSGASPLAPERIIQVRLAQTVPTLPYGGRAGTFYPADHVDSPVFDLLSERFLLAGTEAARTKLRASGKWQERETLPGNTVFENRGALPRAFLVSRVKHVDYKGAIAFVRQEHVNFLETAAVEGAPTEVPDVGSGGDVHFVSYQNDEVRLEVKATGRALLVVGEAWYPGWKAYIDDHETTIYATDVALRGIFVPAGPHRIRMEFRPGIFTVAAAISGVSAGILLLTAFGFNDARTAQSRFLRRIRFYR